MKNKQKIFFGVVIIILALGGFFGGKYFLEKDSKFGDIKSDLEIIEPSKNVTWQMGTSQDIKWERNLKGIPKDASQLRLEIYLQDSYGKQILLFDFIESVFGHPVDLNQASTTSVYIPYSHSQIVPGDYRLVLKSYFSPPPPPPGLPRPGTENNYKKDFDSMVVSTKGSAIITLTLPREDVPPMINSIKPYPVRVGEVVSINGVAFQNDTKVILEREEYGLMKPIKITILPQFVSSNKITFIVPSSCGVSDICPQGYSIVLAGYERTSYKLSVQTRFGVSSFHSDLMVEK